MINEIFENLLQGKTYFDKVAQRNIHVSILGTKVTIPGNKFFIQIFSVPLIVDQSIPGLDPGSSDKFPRFDE